MNLFQRGDFILNSGIHSNLKIDADALTDEDIETVAWLISGELWHPFGSVVGVPRGGLRLAEAMRQYARPYKTNRVLIVDDVYTTGGSMEQHRASLYAPGGPQFDTIGAVIFSKGEPANWIMPLLTLYWGV